MMKLFGRYCMDMLIDIIKRYISIFLLYFVTSLPILTQQIVLKNCLSNMIITIGI